jgi:16S rRNA C1402 N4-methylase RsmH
VQAPASAADVCRPAGPNRNPNRNQSQELRALVGIDLDPTAHRLAGARLERARAALGGRPGPAVHLLRGNYSEVAALLEGVPGGSLVGRVDAMLMDLGVSSMQVGVGEVAGRWAGLE